MRNARSMGLTLRFWGTRGSVPAPGADTVRYGGNTPCAEVRTADGALIILDAGTGKTVGDICSRTARSTCAASSVVLQIVNRFPARKIGAKNGMPWM